MARRAANTVLRIPPAVSGDAADHFERRLGLETDCWDVHATQGMEDRGFVLLDVRPRDHFERGHLPGAVSLPHAEITAERLAGYADDTLFVVYCAGPQCNGAHKAALRIATLGRPVKEMVGGIEGWKDEGFALARKPRARRAGVKLTIEEAERRLAEHRSRFASPCHEANFIGLFRHGTLEIEICKPHKVDLQQPHDKDEVYFVASGTGQFEHNGEREPFKPGDVFFVPAGDSHRFVDFSDDFATWVVFYGPDGGEA